MYLLSVHRRLFSGVVLNSFCQDHFFYEVKEVSSYVLFPRRQAECQSSFCNMNYDHLGFSADLHSATWIMISLVFLSWNNLKELVANLENLLFEVLWLCLKREFWLKEGDKVQVKGTYFHMKSLSQNTCHFLLNKLYISSFVCSKKIHFVKNWRPYSVATWCKGDNYIILLERKRKKRDYTFLSSDDTSDNNALV